MSAVLRKPINAEVVLWGLVPWVEVQHADRGFAMGLMPCAPLVRSGRLRRRWRQRMRGQALRCRWCQRHRWRSRRGVEGMRWARPRRRSGRDGGGRGGCGDVGVFRIACVAGAVAPAVWQALSAQACQTVALDRMYVGASGSAFASEKTLTFVRRRLFWRGANGACQQESLHDAVRIGSPPAAAHVVDDVLQTSPARRSGHNLVAFCVSLRCDGHWRRDGDGPEANVVPLSGRSADGVGRERAMHRAARP